MTTQLDGRRRVVLHVALVELAARHANQRTNQRYGPPIPPPALKFLAPSAMPHDTPQKRRLLALSVFEALVRVVAARAEIKVHAPLRRRRDFHTGRRV